MTSIEIAFFGLALLLPLVGGGALLYFLAKGAKAEKEKKGEDPRDK